MAVPHMRSLDDLIGCLGPEPPNCNRNFEIDPLLGCTGPTLTALLPYFRRIPQRLEGLCINVPWRRFDSERARLSDCLTQS